MFLKRVTLHGFKSFADRTELEFGPGVTTIVGPNGCGKSNVLDAIRWVLGEQSARTLRGEKMLDVIFSGARSRKPATFAEVELTFDNATGFFATPEPEVSVGRILYRSGDSEYRLNGNACRLKDIRDLLLDTGVGVDAYSVIAQGQVDLLLQANPVERREIFEEAAGISRYKVRRAEAQRKLERTQQNLLRLNDLLEELERRLRSVKLAAGKARSYQEYDARLRSLRSSFSLAEYHDLQQALARIVAKIAQLSEEVAAKRGELAAHDAEAQSAASEIAELDSAIEAADADVLRLRSLLSALAERIAQGARRVGDLSATRARRLAQAEEIEQRGATLRAGSVAERQRLDELRAAEVRIGARADELQGAADGISAECERARGALEQARSAAFAAERQSAVLHNEQASLQQQLARLRGQSERNTERLGQLAAERAALTERQSGLAQRVSRIELELAAQTDALRAAEGELSRLERERERLAGEIGELKEQRSAVLSRLELLEDQERRYEGVDAGARAVLAWRDAAEPAGSVRGLVADLLRIDDPRVALLQGLLATFEDHVVVRNTHAFFAELARRGGPAGAIRVCALDRIGAPGAWHVYHDAPGFVARAADWVRCGDEFRPLAEHLLGRVVIVDGLDRALALADAAPEGWVFVTLAGEAIGANGQFTIGASTEARGLISRKTEIRQLAQQRDDVETHLEARSRERNAAEQRAADAQLRRGGLLGEIAAGQRAHAETRTEMLRASDGLGRAEREAGVVESELDALRRALAEIGAQLDGVERAHSAAADVCLSHAGEIDAAARELAAREGELAAARRELTDLLVARARAREQVTGAETALGELEQREAALAAERRQVDDEAAEAGREIEAAQRESSAAQAEQESRAGELENRAARAAALRERRQAVRVGLDERGALVRELQREIEQLEADLHEDQIAQREAEVRREALTARVREELGVCLDELYAGYQHAEQDWSAVRAEIDELRQKIARLGNVNLDAIAELDELQPRFDALTAQRGDLLDSIAQLEALIVQLDTESCTRFLATFEAIRANFQELFRKLFGGGKADVLLEDPDRPLECGLEIIARPPGKEPQSISLLSGGEKTMTAVALLMAVFRSRPSPFAILDEVDAALDEANVERFNSLLTEFLAHSQFVVITHSKRTMQFADVLYGITMEEPGVSKRVSVRFDERVQTPVVA